MKKAIREGEIKLGNVSLRVAVLEDGERVFVGDDILKIFQQNAVYTQEEAVKALEKMQEL